MVDQILSLTKKLMEIPSDVNHREACLAALNFAQKELEEFPFTPFVTDNIPSVLYTNTAEPTKKCKIILNAHVDVVPASPEQFTPVEKDGRLYGRGAYDMKAATAVMILLFKELANKLPYTLGLQITTDEEIVGVRGTNYQLDNGVTGEFVITGECGSNLRIIHKLRGLYVIKLSASGQKAHAGHLWYGKNALLLLYEAINSLLQHYPTPTEPTWKTTINVASIHTSNETHNMVPADATAILDVRFTKEDTEHIISKIASLLPDGVTMEIQKHMPSHFTDKNNPFVHIITSAFRSVLNTEAEISENYGGSDLIFHSMHGIDGVEFGPKGSGQHSSDEWVDIESIEHYYKILKKFLLSVK